MNALLFQPALSLRQGRHFLNIIMLILSSWGVAAQTTSDSLLKNVKPVVDSGVISMFGPNESPRLANHPTWGLAVSTSYTIPNRREWDYITQPTLGIDASLLWHTLGVNTTGQQEGWQQAWHRPWVGIRANAVYCHNGIAGNRFGVGGFIINPFSDSSPWAWMFGGGLSLFSNPYSRTQNSQNYFIGSYLNCLLECGIIYGKVLNNSPDITWALKFVHASNGYLQKPNKGLNYIQCEWGIRLHTPEMHNEAPEYILQYPDLQVVAPFSSGQALSASYFYASYAPGMAKPRYTGSAKTYYYCHTAEIGYMVRPMGRRQSYGRFAYGGGIDLTYNYTQEALSAFHKDPYPFPFYLCWFGTIEPYWGPLSLRLSAGGYLLKSQLTALVSLPFFERLGVYYHFGRTLPQFAGVSMRCYAAHIDFIEWTYGIQLPTKSRNSREK